MSSIGVAANEMVLGFPGAALGALVAALEQLNAKAVGRSRAKAMLHSLKNKKGVIA